MARPHQDKRRHPRFKVTDVYVEYTEKSLLSFLRSRKGLRFPLINLSEGGVQFMSDRSFPRGRHLALTIQFPALPEPLVQAAVVAWTTGNASTKVFRIGVEFVDVEKKTRELLRKICGKWTGQE